MALAGAVFYGLPIFLSRLTTDRGLPLDSISAGTSVFFITGSVAGLFVGRWVANHDPRPLLVLSAVIGGASVIAIGQVTEVWQAYIAYGGLGIAFIGMGSGPATVAVLRHSKPQSRARTLAISTMGISIGGVAVSPIFSYCIDKFSFSTATIAFGIGVTVVVTACGTLIMPASPPLGPISGEPVGVDTSPGTDASSAKAPVVRRDVPFAQAVRGPAFWLVIATASVFLTAQVGVLAHIVRLCSDRGIALTGVVISIVTIAAVAARFIGSWTLSRITVWPWAIGVCALQVVATFELAFARNEVLLIIGALLFGLSLGNTPLMMTLLLVETFGLHAFPTLAGLQGLFTALGAGIGPVLVSIVYNSAGNYTLALVTVGFIGAGAVVIAALAGRAARKVGEQRLIAAPISA